MNSCKRIVAFGLLVALTAASATAADWPQFMRDPAHTGDAADESLQLPLGLLAQVKLDDAVTTSPAVVGGRAYVVDQMGTAYCLDPRAGRIVWKVSPDGGQAMGANTSSPCVVQGRVCYGTTAGTFHILDARDGKTIKRLNVGFPIVSSPTFANGSLYFQALDAVLRCLHLDGKERWKWDHYQQYKEPPELTKSKEKERGHPGSYDRPHYGGGEVVVSGKQVVTSFGWDVACVEDAGTEAKLRWCNRAPAGRDGASPMSSSISGDWVFTGGMGADGHLGLMRLSLSDGQIPKDGYRSNGSAFPWLTPAVRGSAVTMRDSSYGKDGILLHDFESKKTLASWRDEKSATPVIGSHALAKDHLAITTLHGELIVVEIAAKAGTKAFRFKTPHGKGIGSAPVLSGGCVHFGCDDGYFYVLGPGGTLEPKPDEQLAIHEPRGQVRPATGKAYAWPSTYGNPGNSSFVDDAGLQPPFRVRWATRGYGHFLTPCVTTADDLLTVSLTGLVSCQEQATGRLRWRQQLPGPAWGNGSGLLAADGRLYVPRPNGQMEGGFYCLDLKTGAKLWSGDIGGRYIWERAAPVLAGGKIAFGFSKKGTPAGTIIQAWDAADGKPAWQVELKVAGNRSGSIGGATDGKAMYFTAGAGAWQWKQEGDKQRGEAVAIDSATGKVLWRMHELFGATYPVLVGDKLLLNDSTNGLCCVAPKDGQLLWKRASGSYTRFSIGSDFIAMRGYGGQGAKIRLDDGKDYPGRCELGGPTHACSPVSLTPNISVAITVGGLNVRDAKTGELLWLSPGFAPRGCVNPALANGRAFWPSAASGMIYCFEPEIGTKP